jgi:hypothetical protein
MKIRTNNLSKNYELTSSRPERSGVERPLYFIIACFTLMIRHFQKLEAAERRTGRKTKYRDLSTAAAKAPPSVEMTYVWGAREQLRVNTVVF